MMKVTVFVLLLNPKRRYHHIRWNRGRAFESIINNQFWWNNSSWKLVHPAPTHTIVATALIPFRLHILTYSSCCSSSSSFWLNRLRRNVATGQRANRQVRRVASYYKSRRTSYVADLLNKRWPILPFSLSLTRSLSCSIFKVLVD